MDVLILSVLFALFGGLCGLSHPDTLRTNRLALVTNSEHVTFCKWDCSNWERSVLHFSESKPTTGEQHTLGHVGCSACAAARTQAMDPRGFADLPFSQAFPIWLSTRTRLSEASRADYKKNFKRLEPFFGALKLCEIHIGHILEYREGRTRVAGAGRINKEINTVQQILARAGLWDAIGKWYEPLPLPKDSAGTALSEEEERYFFQVAQRKRKWAVAYYADLLMRNTCCGPGEIRHIRIGAIDVAHQTLTISEGVKNGYRERVVPLSDVAYWCCLQLLDRAAQRGCTQPEHYLLPARKPVNEHGFDPNTPMASWKKAHGAIRKQAAKKFPHLARLRRYDFRHTGCTVMLENPAISYGTIERIMGHRLGSNIKEKYSHIRDSVLRQAVNALESRKPPSNVRGKMIAMWKSNPSG